MQTHAEWYGKQRIRQAIVQYQTESAHDCTPLSIEVETILQGTLPPGKLPHLHPHSQGPSEA